MSELLEYSIAERFDEGRRPGDGWAYSIAERFDEGRRPGDGWARIMCQRAVRMPEPSVSGAQA